VLAFSDMQFCLWPLPTAETFQRFISLICATADNDIKQLRRLEAEYVLLFYFKFYFNCAGTLSRVTHRRFSDLSVEFLHKKLTGPD